MASYVVRNLTVHQSNIDLSIKNAIQSAYVESEAVRGGLLSGIYNENYNRISNNIVDSIKNWQSLNSYSKNDHNVDFRGQYTYFDSYRPL
jgi:hypothetical protein